MALDKYKGATKILYFIEDIWYIFVTELRNIFHDTGVMVIFFLGGTIYPILYPLVYKDEVVQEMPIAIVDDSNSELSREFIRELDATREVHIVYHCLNMQEAQDLYERRLIHGVVYFPKDFQSNIESLKGQSTVSLYFDMASFLYYKTLMLASTNVMLHYHEGIQVKRYEMLGMTGEQAYASAKPLLTNDVPLYNGPAGFASFLLPALLVMILHQTLFFGIGMMAGVSREKNGELFHIEGRRNEKSTFRVVLGRSFAYILIYLALSAYCLLLVPRIFHYPHIGDVADVLRLIVPFVTATTFFAMTVSVFVRERETGMVSMLFLSLVFLFLAGVSWPEASIPKFWHYISYLVPSTFAVQGYIHINTYGASISQTSFEYLGLWIQAACYMFTCCLFYYLAGKVNAKRKDVLINKKE